MVVVGNNVLIVTVFDGLARFEMTISDMIQLWGHGWRTHSRDLHFWNLCSVAGKSSTCTHGSWGGFNSFSEPFEGKSTALILLRAGRQPASLLSQFHSPTPYPTCMCSFFPLSLREPRLFFCTYQCLTVCEWCVFFVYSYILITL